MKDAQPKINNTGNFNAPLSSPPPQLVRTGTFLAAALLLVFTAPVQADEAVLVSNINQANDGDITLNFSDFAQGFMTGGNTGDPGYTLGSIQLYLTGGPELEGPVRVGLYSIESGTGGPGTELCTLINPGNLGFGLRRFRADSSCPELAANTYYFVYMAYTHAGTNAYRVRSTSSNNEDTGAAPGWSINEKYYFRNKTGSNTNWREASSSEAIEIRVRAANTPPTASSQEVSIDEDTEHTFTVTSFGFNDNDSDPLAHVEITSLPGGNEGVLLLDGAAISSAPQEVTATQLTNGDLKYAPPDNDSGDDFTTFNFRVYDGWDYSVSTYSFTFDVTAVSDAPIANAGPDQGFSADTLVSSGDTVMLDGTGSSDADNDMLTYLWVQTAPVAGQPGSGVVLDTSTPSQPTFVVPQLPANTTLTFSLTVSDADSLTADDTDTVSIRVTAAGDAPTADAGPDQGFTADALVSEGDTVMLDGTGSSDPEGVELEYTWVQTAPVAGQPGSGVVLDTSTPSRPTFAAPQLPANTTLAFRLTASDGVNTSIPDDVSIRVTADDDAPTADAGPDQGFTADALVSEGDTVMLDGTGSSDPEGVELEYTWVQTAPVAGQPGSGVVLDTSTPSRPTFVAPQLPVNTTLTFRLTVSDGVHTSMPDDVSIRVTATLARINRVNEEILPHVAQAIAASTLSAITGRMDAAVSGIPAGAFNLAGDSQLFHVLQSSGQALEDGTLDFAELLGSSSFVLPLNAAEDGGVGGMGGLVVWGSGDYRELSGGEDSAVDWDGDLLNFHLGADMWIRPDLLAGLSVSRSRGSFNFTDRTDLLVVDGRYESRMTSVYPYVSWSRPEGLSLWATVGYGEGDIEIDEDGVETQSSDTEMRTVAAGASFKLLSNDDLIVGGTTTLRLKGEGSLARVKVEGNGRINPLISDVRRLRLSFEGSHEHELGSGGRLIPSAQLGLRHDNGDAVTGVGVEVGGSLRYVDPAVGLTVEGRGRLLVAHRDDYEEWGIGGLVRLDPGTESRGLSVSLAPTWGETQSGVQQLWNDGMIDRAANDDIPQMRLDGELGYGLGVLGGKGLLTPYGVFSLAGEGSQLYRIGTRFEIGSTLQLSLEGERHEAANGSAEHGVMLRGQLRF